MLVLKSIGNGVKNLMINRIKPSYILFCRALFISFFVLAVTTCFAQWEDSFGHEWIDYNQPYLRIDVQKEGIQQLKVSSLPNNFRSIDPNLFQLWYRGKEVAIIRADRENILFWGVLNDGASDSLFYRPKTDRINPYLSLYSDKGYFFLTYGSRNGKRSKVVDQNTEISEAIINNQLAKQVVTFKDNYALGTYTAGTHDALLNSFYTRAKTWVSNAIAGPKSVTSFAKDTVFNYRFETNHISHFAEEKGEVEIAVTGLRSGPHNIVIYVGSNNGGGLREATNLQFTGFDTRRIKVPLKESDFSLSGELFVRLESKTDAINDWFGVSHMVLAYPQELDIVDRETYRIAVPEISSKFKRIKIKNVLAGNYEIVEVSNPHEVSVIPSDFFLTTNEISLSDLNKNSADVYISKGIFSEITIAQISSVDFNKITFASQSNYRLNSGGLDPGAFDFLMITNNTLETAAVQYAQYRSSSEGGSYRTLLMNIRDIYNQFNYGEPSPTAIRRFVNYMLSQGVRESKHNLLLLGHSITYSERVIKELPDEVPSVGDPASDILLVAGLKGSPVDLAAIPVGRVSALNEQSLLNYLEKVKIFERESKEALWKKEVLHLSGGHSNSEIAQLSGILRSLESQVSLSEFGGHVTPRVKVAGVSTSENVDISESINSGVGLLTFFGHGSQANTDLNFGFVTDATRGYLNTERYPLMYFNGCGVGNVFTSRTAVGIAGDWLFAKNRGAIALVGNSYFSYVSSSAKHLSSLYKELFSDVKTELSIGQILNRTSEAILSSSPNAYDVANIHQINLMGDPAIKLLRFEKPDYIVDDESIAIYSDTPEKKLSEASKVITRIHFKNSGLFYREQNIEVDVTFFYRDGTSEVKQILTQPIAFQDTLSFEVEKKGELARVLVRINPNEKIEEALLSNNLSELIVDWDTAKELHFYPTEPVRDLVPPRLKVFFDNRIIRNGDYVRPAPNILFYIEDDRLLQHTNVEDQIEVYYRTCEECSLIRIPSEELVPTAITQNNEQGIAFSYNGQSMIKGDFELVVIAKDRAGNSLTSPYIVRYKIKEAVSPSTTNWSVIASPNPATNYIKFTFPLIEETLSDKTEFYLYDNIGRQVHRETVDVDAHEWYFFPTKSMSGIFMYRFLTESINNVQSKPKSLSGKIVINN